MTVTAMSKRPMRRQVNVRVVPTGKAMEESVDLAFEIFNRVFRRVPERMPDDRG
jgi:hypothetical protein